MVIGAVIVCLFTICDRKARVLPEPVAHNKQEMGDLKGVASVGQNHYQAVSASRKKRMGKQGGQMGC